MSRRIVLLSQMPVKNRYQEDWIDIWVRELRKLGIEPIVIGDREVRVIDRSKPYNYFTNTDEAIVYEAKQVIKAVEHLDIGRMLVLDVNFPGLMLPALHIFKLIKPSLKIYGVLHAGSWCNGDIWSRVKGRREFEYAIFKSYDKIFVGSKYHKRKIERYFGEKFENIVVTGLPFYKKDILKYVKPLMYTEKEGIFVNGRPEQSKTDWLEQLVKSLPYTFYIPYTVSFTSPNLKMITLKTRDEYFNLLSRVRVMISLKSEETFGYATLEACVLNTVPIAPKKFSYPEILPSSLLYDSFDELIEKVRKAYTENLFIDVKIDLYEKVVEKIVSEIEW